MITEYFEVRLYVNGIKKGERKVKRHGIKLSNCQDLVIQYDKERLAKVIEEAKAKASSEMKSILQGNSHLSFCHTSEDSKTPDMITSQPFHESNFQLKVEL